jgi:hypothetical protein
MKHYNATNSIEDCYAQPLKYCLGLIFNKMLDEKVRFELPYAKGHY